MGYGLVRRLTTLLDVMLGEAKHPFLGAADSSGCAFRMTLPDD
jgi:hypothetical protein